LGGEKRGVFAASKKRTESALGVFLKFEEGQGGQISRT